MGSVTYNTPGETGYFAVPFGVSAITVEMFGAGGNGCGNIDGGGGGGGGAYAKLNSYSTFYPNQHKYYVGDPDGDGGSYLTNNSETALVCLADGGDTPSGSLGGTGGLISGSIGDVKYAGGNGGDGSLINPKGGGGGSSAGTGTNGTNGAAGDSGGTGGGAPTGGAAGGNGGDSSDGSPGSLYGGGGGGSGGAANNGGAGKSGKIVISWAEPPLSVSTYSRGGHRRLENFQLVKLGGSRVLNSFGSLIQQGGYRYSVGFSTFTRGGYDLRLGVSTRSRGGHALVGFIHIDTKSLGYYRTLQNISGIVQKGRSRVQNNSDGGYNVYVGEDAMPDILAAPAYFTNTLPFDIPITPPGFGTKTIYVILRKQNTYGVESQNLYPYVFVVDSNGDLVRNPISTPVGTLASPVSAGTLRIMSSYSTRTLEQDPADIWRIWVGLTEPDPDVDPFTVEYTVNGDELTGTVDSLIPGHYFVVVRLFRTIDSAVSEAVVVEVDLPAAPDNPSAVRSGYEVLE